MQSFQGRIAGTFLIHFEILLKWDKHLLPPTAGNLASKTVTVIEVCGKCKKAPIY